jgi:acyl-CoA thioesterase
MPEPKDNIADLKEKFQKEHFAKAWGMQLLELSPGYAKFSMKLKPEYQNFNGLTFGGIIMSIADMAFAYCVNSVNRPSVAINFDTQFVAAPKPDDELIAEGRVIKTGRRLSIAEMTVTNQEGKLIAKATGTTIKLEKS